MGGLVRMQHVRIYIHTCMYVHILTGPIGLSYIVWGFVHLTGPIGLSYIVCGFFSCFLFSVFWSFVVL